MHCHVTKAAADRVTGGVFLRGTPRLYAGFDAFGGGILWGIGFLYTYRHVIVFVYTERRLVSKGTSIHGRGRTARREGYGAYGRLVDCRSTAASFE